MKLFGLFLTIWMTFAGSALASAVTPADATAPKKTLTLVGLGEVKTRPDMAVIQLGVVREAQTARQAVTANNAAMAQIIETVLSVGIAEKDIQTSGFSVQPRYVHFPPSKSRPQRPPEIRGYSVSNNLSVVVRDLSILGGTLDAVVSAGSNRIGGISFAVQNTKPLLDEARRKAVKDAIDKAELYAAAAGITLGDIISISEQTTSFRPRPVHARAMAVSSFKESAVPVARGEQSLRMQVNIVWQIR